MSISSGTWSLPGVVNRNAITSLDSYTQNFTNEGGAWGRYGYLKNIMGLWMIQSVRRELNGESYVLGKEKRGLTQRQWSFADLIDVAVAETDYHSVEDVNLDCFLSPESMMQTIRDVCIRTKRKPSQNIGEIMQCVYTSLSLCYSNAIRSLQKNTGKHDTSINIVGSGCQDDYLNLCTARATGLPVYASPVEGTAIGNLVIQLVSGGRGEFAGGKRHYSQQF